MKNIKTMKMKTIAKLLAILLVLIVECNEKDANAQTYCNPLNISYRFCLDRPSRREAADPLIVLYKDNYYLFASRSGGYWYSSDLLNWNFVPITNLQIENYAPAAMVLRDSLYFLPSGTNYIYRSGDPKNPAAWVAASTAFPTTLNSDASLLADTDGKVYLYYGVSNVTPIYGIELDNKVFKAVGKAVTALSGNPGLHGWETPGDYNQIPNAPWIEGSWMNKINGKYYLQYAGPGTEFKAYSDGVYVSDNPLGPFTYAENNPFSEKPEGFICGAGHSGTFADKYGNYWHISTMTISVKHMFERRLGLFPVAVDNDGVLYTNTVFGDYPMTVPDHKITDIYELNTGLMLLSYNKKIEVSSSNDTFPANLASDENIRTYWSAKTGNAGEWLMIDLDTVCAVRALQVNLAESNPHMFGRDTVKGFQFLVEYSNDKTSWLTLWDKTTNEEDLTHQFITFDTAVKAQYIKVTNYRVPSGEFAISDLRVFGTGKIGKPGKVSSFSAIRETYDLRHVTLIWNKQPRATGYMIRYGAQPDKLYQSYQVYSDTSITIRKLNVSQTYYFRIDAFGEDGVTTGESYEIPVIKHSVIEAEKYSGQSGIKTEYCMEGTLDVTNIAGGDYIYFDSIDFGTSTATLDLRVASAKNDTIEVGSIEIRIGSADGTLLGTAKVYGTGNAQLYKTINCALTGASGLQKVYLVFRLNPSSSYRINWLELKDRTVGIHKTIDKKYGMHTNQNNNQLIIEGLQTTTELTIWNMSGQKIMAAKTSGILDISNLKTGIYLVQIGKEQPLKFVKQ
jgi:xylan 1,4-beta-xylosidase